MNTRDTTALAFPGAEGFGKHTTGGRGGKVYVVSNLNDSGAGSFREAVAASGARTILFAVSGNIKLKSPLRIEHGNVTIAGQSAPGDGICIQDFPVTIHADNVVVRFMRFRLGDLAKLEADAFGGNDGNADIIIDHCSISWATDECASFYRNKNFTLQWCIISESLNHSVHAKGDHGYGGIWGGEGATFHHNLVVSHTSRLPRFSGSATTPNTPNERVDFRNNVVCNWADNNVYGGEKGHYNMVNNYFKPGPATPQKKHWFVNPYLPCGSFYVDGNVFEGDAHRSAQNWDGVHTEYPDSVRATQPFHVVTIATQRAEDAFAAVLTFSGASLHRDAADTRIVEAVRSGKFPFGKNNNGIIDSQADVGGWPVLLSTKTPPDANGNHLPDAWEQTQHLNAHNASDATALSTQMHYTPLEQYLNHLVKNCMP
ncbi:pectate lyase [Chryseolinea sp. Jin1]|uniref:Pectate lyase n=2 Tax=Chryseolinea lacunae TaxID=2801331 RepID=A0ABS1KNE8_9BACT|nr:pectate lyase [Chryseolinea lacunae]